MSNILVSIIVPVYNTGEYLYKCLDSIVNQNLQEIELILIDDGSTDNSGKICDFYSKKDKRVCVIHKKNEGVSIARNVGIQVAKGEYIGFVDSDDWIEKEMYQELYYYAKETGADIVMCDACTVYDGNKKEADTISSLNESVLLNKKEITPLNLREIAGSACRCIYKKELLEVHAVQFPIGLPLSEDRIFNLKSMGNSEKFYYLKKAYYNRYVRTGSAVNKYYPNLLEITNQYRREVLNVIEKLWGTDDSYRQAYNQQFLVTYMSVVYNLYNLDCPLKMGEKRIELKELVSNQDLIEILEECNILDWKSKLLKRKQILILLILGKLYQVDRKSVV